ncbi:hypothetical protein G9A89_010488 [Geosiphon pyriformis]|nr:hypothetical protein G9A89_010488 [Geosiphon pyriformis]
MGYIELTSELTSETTLVRSMGLANTSIMAFLQDIFTIINKGLNIYTYEDISKIIPRVEKHLTNIGQSFTDLFKSIKVTQISSNSVFVLGFFYQFGIEININLEQTFLKYQKSTSQKNPLGQFFLRKYYMEGTGTEKNNEKAVEWYTKAA